MNAARLATVLALAALVGVDASAAEVIDPARWPVVARAEGALVLRSQRACPAGGGWGKTWREAEFRLLEGSRAHLHACWRPARENGQPIDEVAVCAFTAGWEFVGDARHFIPRSAFVQTSSLPQAAGF